MSSHTSIPLLHHNLDRYCNQTMVLELQNAGLEAIKPHVVILPSPGMGHVIPMLELAKRFVLHHGCHVTFLHITTGARSTHTGFLCSPDLPPSLDVVDLPPVDLSAVVSDNTPVLSQICLNAQETIRCRLKPTLSQLPKKPQALVTDMFCTQAFDICKDLSIPAYILSTTSAIFLAFSMFCLQLTPEAVSSEFLHVPGCTPLRTKELPLGFGEEHEWAVYHISRFPMAAGIFMNSWEDLELESVRALRENPFYKQVSTPPVYPIGPLVKESEPVRGSGEECLAWLDKQPSGSVVFVALGSGGSLCGEQLTELAWGLELSQKRFLWVVRAPTNVSGLKNYLKAGTDLNDPKSYLPEGFMERTRDLGMVVASWAPQVSVLRHASTGAFLSHCGWNSILESMVQGVPLITWPLYFDQMANATMLVEDVGVGIRPAMEEGKKVIGRKEIERVVRAAMEGEEGKAIRSKAREIQASASKALNPGGKSYEVLADVVNQWNLISS